MRVSTTSVFRISGSGYPSENAMKKHLEPGFDPIKTKTALRGKNAWSF
jgi:hypothetical protein